MLISGVGHSKNSPAVDVHSVTFDIQKCRWSVSNNHDWYPTTTLTPGEETVIVDSSRYTMSQSPPHHGKGFWDGLRTHNRRGINLCVAKNPGRSVTNVEELIKVTMCGTPEEVD